MAENTEVIVLEIDAQQAITELALMTQDLDALKKSQKEFTRGSEEYEALATTIKIASKEQSDFRRTLEASVTARKKEVDEINFANNSIKQNRELLKTLTAQYIQLKNPTTAQTNQIKALSDALKVQEKAIGDTRRSVGNYTESFKAAFSELKIGGVNVGAIANQLPLLSEGFKAAGGGVKGFSAALASLGFPLIIMGVQTLISLFSSFKPIVDAVEVAVSALGASFSAFVSGGSILEAGAQAAQLTKELQDLEDEMAGQAIVNAEYEKSIRTAIKAAADQGKTELERLQILEAAGQKLREQFEENEEILNDEIRIKEALFKNEKNITQRQLDALLMSKKSYLKKYDDVTADELDEIKSNVESRISIEDAALQKLRQLRIDKLNEDQRSQQLEEKINNMRSAVIDKIDAKDEKARADEKKRAEDAAALANKRAETEAAAAKKRTEIAAAEEQRLSDLAKFRLDQQEDSLEKRLDLFELESAKTIENMRKLGASQIEIEQYIAAQRLKIEKDFYTQQGEAMLQAMQKRAQEQKAFDDQIKQNREFDAEIMKEFNITQEQMDAEFAAGNYENSKALYDAKKALKDKELADSVKKAEEEKKIEQAVFESAQSLTNSLAQIGNVMMGNSAAGLAFQKVLAGIQIGIDTARAISSVIAAATAAGAFAGPAAIIVTVANIATGIATVVANIAKATQLLSGANTPEVPQLQTFAEGGEFVPVGGKSHAEGGTKFRGSDGSGFEAERGEGIFIMKKSAMSNIGALSNHNMAYGGRSWFGGQTKYAEDGGLVFDGGLSSRAIADQNNPTATLLNAFRNLPPAQVSVVEINRVSSNRVEAVDSVSI